MYAQFFRIYLSIYKQPMMTGQGLKKSLATQRITKIGRHTHTHKYTHITLKTENTVDGDVILIG